MFHIAAITRSQIDQDVLRAQHAGLQLSRRNKQGVFALKAFHVYPPFCCADFAETETETEWSGGARADAARH
jgi:hypothetical protein